jgi:hypothetical protein
MADAMPIKWTLPISLVYSYQMYKKKDGNNAKNAYASGKDANDGAQSTKCTEVHEL